MNECDKPEIEDTVDTEDIPNLHSYLLPSTHTLNSCHSFGIHYRKCLFDAWVKQPSPCCAASALAGAINVLSNKKRSDVESLNHQDILALYRHMYEEKISQKLSSFERQIGGGNAISVFTSLSSCIQSYLTSESLHAVPVINHDHGRKSVSRSRLMLDTNLIQRTIHNLRINNNSTSDEAMKVFLELTNCSQNSDSIRAWDWDGDILALLKAIKGYRSLSRVDKPSTSPIGNGEFISAAIRIADSLQSHSGERMDLRAVLLMGQTGKLGRAKVEIPISARADECEDDDEILRAQWNQLK